MTWLVGKRSFPLDVGGWSYVVCTPPGAEQSEAAAYDWNTSAEADCNTEGARTQSNSQERHWRLSSPGNWSLSFSLSACSQPRTASRRAHLSSSDQF